MPQQFFLLTIAALDVELQADVQSSVPAENVLHEAVMRFKNPSNLVADFLDAGPRHFIAVQQKLEIECFFHVSKNKK